MPDAGPPLPPAPPPRLYRCPRAPAPLTIDADLAKPAWAAAPWTDDFVDIEGSPPRPSPRHRTRARLLWDDEHLYVAAALDEPNVWATLTARDSVVYHDNDIEVFLFPPGGTSDYYELEINALGAVWDLHLDRPYRQGGRADNAFDFAGLRSAVRVHGPLNDPREAARGWDVELAIPWRSMDRHTPRPAAPDPGDRWRLNFSRVQWDAEPVPSPGAGPPVFRKLPGRPEHNWVWSPTGVIDMHLPDRWGIVEFLDEPGA
jgi:hypothetical protein